MPLDGGGQRVAEPCDDQRPLEPQRRRHVVGHRAGIELRQDPQPPLRVRQRVVIRVRHARDPTRVRPPRTIDDDGELLNRRAGKDRAEGDLDAEASGDSAHHLRRLETMPPEIEEVVGDTAAFKRQHVAPHLG